MENPELNNTQAAIEAGKQLMMNREPIYINDTPHLVVPENCTLHKLEYLREYPQHIEETVHHSTAASFINYYQKFATENSVVFLNAKSNVFIAIFDYHAPGQPDWTKHRSYFELIKTPEWIAWLTNDKKSMNQPEFGMFIENNLEEIITPSGAEMLEIALSMQANTKIKFSQAIRLDNGQTSLQYVEDIDGKAGLNGSLKIPEKFTIGLKLFEGGEAYQIDARFRYRIKDGNLAIWYELIRPHKTINANLDDTKALLQKSMAVGNFYEKA